MRAARERYGDVLGVGLNWNQAIIHEVEFDTEIRVTRSGVEQREASRQSPRMTMALPVTVTREASARLLADLRRDTLKVWQVPVPWRHTQVAAPADAAQNDIEVDAMPFWAVPGSWIIVRGLGPTAPAEAARIDGVSGNVMTLTEPLQAAHGLPARVSAAYPMRYPDDVRLQALSPGVLNGLFAFERDPGRVPEPWHPVAPPRYEGNDLFLWRPNWRDGIELAWSRTHDRVDFGRGRIEISSAVNFASERRQPHLYAFDNEKAERLLTFFLRQKGRRGSFWSPSWIKDFRFETGSHAGSDAVTLTGLDYLDAYRDSRVYNRVIHLRDDGSYQINRVIAMGDSGGHTRVTFADSWQRSLSTDSRLHWLLRSRFSADNLSMSWETAGTAHAGFSLTSLPTDEAQL